MFDPSSSDSLESIRAYLDARDFDLFHFYFGYPYGSYLDELGCNGYVPYSVFYDRDGYIRLIDDPTPVWEPVFQQCLGIYTP